MDHCSPVQRQNIRHIYLAQFGEEIISHCITHYRESPKAEIRRDLLRFVLRYARHRSDVIDFALCALDDKSSTVRESACAVLAYGFADRGIPKLQALADAGKQPTARSAENAILAIRTRNHNLYYPDYHGWLVSQDDPDEPKDDSVVNYIEKFAPALVPGLENIYGSLRGKFSGEAG